MPKQHGTTKGGARRSDQTRSKPGPQSYGKNMLQGMRGASFDTSSDALAFHGSGGPPPGMEATARTGQPPRQAGEGGPPLLPGGSALRPAMGGGAMLPGGVQEQMEASFGFDFSDVRVHQDGRAASIGAHAYTQGSNIHFAPGQYSPSSPPGRRLLGHELAHVVQQRHGRVQGISAKGADVNTDPALEREADSLGDAAAEGKSARVPGSPGGGGKSVIQGYFRIDHADQANANVGINSTLPAMAHHPGTTSHRNAGGALNIVDDNPAGGGGPTADLRISDDGLLAIEDVDLTGRQPRVFFADANLVTVFNEQLKARTGADKLATNPGNTVDVPDAATNTLHNLVEVVPANFNTAANCNTVANSLTGADSLNTNVKLGPGAPGDAPQGTRGHDVFERLAHYVARGDEPGEQTMHAAMLDTGNGVGPDMANINNRIAEERANPNTNMAWLGGNSDTAAQMDAREQALGINSYASPGVGEMFGSMSLGAYRNFGGADNRQYDAQRAQWMSPSQPGGNRSWGTHFGGVVAKSGSDHVTLENYNRTVEDTGIGGNAGPHGRWYFQMYGTKRTAALNVHHNLAGNIRAGDDAQGADQSWHHAWSQAGRPIINGVTATIGKPVHQMNARAQAALAFSGTAGSGEITRAHETDLEVNCTPAMQDTLMARFKTGLRRGLDGIGNLLGTRNTAAADDRELAAHAAILRVFATTPGNAAAKLAAAQAARTQLATDGAGSARTTTPPNLVGTLNGYGITVHPANV